MRSSRSRIPPPPRPIGNEIFRPVTAESVMFVNRVDPAATRVDVIFLVVVDGIRWGEKGFEIAD